MIQPGLIVIGDRRYIKADLILIKILTSSTAELIAIWFAVYHIFNLSSPDHLNLRYNFLQNIVYFVEKDTSQHPTRKKSKSLVVKEFSMKIFNQLSIIKNNFFCMTYEIQNKRFFSEIIWTISLWYKSFCMTMKL